MDMTKLFNTLWILVGAAMIFFMQAGFAMLESGFTRAKNTGNIVLKNVIDVAAGSVMFWIIGYGLMYGVGKGGFLGLSGLFLRRASSAQGIPLFAMVAYSTMFCATSATIVSGAMAGRTKFKAYFIYSIVISALIFPVSASWLWGGGWLSTISLGGVTGYIDFSGSSLVHMVGGMGALLGAAMVGPRLGKYDRKGAARVIHGHSLSLIALGVFILWFGWFGFNSFNIACVGNPDGADIAARAFLNTNLSAATSTVTALLLTWVRYGSPDITMTLNGAVAGLVAITAGCADVDPYAAFIIGIGTGFVVVFSVEFVEKKLKVDDPVGAVSVHGFCGLYGTLMTGLFARETGWFTTGNPAQFGIQLIGVVVILAWSGATLSLTFYALKHTVGLRVGCEAEIRGLDFSEHGLVDVGEGVFSGTPLQQELLSDAGGESGADVPTPEEAVPVIYHRGDIRPSDVRLRKIEIITRQSRFEPLKKAMNDIGVTGMTVIQVLGCGTQKGKMEYYRGEKIDEIELLPKIQVEIVVAKVPVEDVVNTARKVLYTGHIGDGKIFIYPVENAIKIRTGEQGYDAMQGVDESNVVEDV